MSYDSHCWDTTDYILSTNIILSGEYQPVNCDWESPGDHWNTCGVTQLDFGDLLSLTEIWCVNWWYYESWFSQWRIQIRIQGAQFFFMNNEKLY